MAADRGKQQAVKLSIRELDDLAALTCQRVHQAIDRATQLVPDGQQQHALVLTVISYLVVTLSTAINAPRDVAIEVMLNDLREVLKDWPE